MVEKYISKWRLIVCRFGRKNNIVEVTKVKLQISKKVQYSMFNNQCSTLGIKPEIPDF